ncbi:hypothetical protein Slin15195_G128940 [Septoria linicola]|uniref:Uncharacterized protein n=1 Tax=Septoria linicola TaxID=215465 RepID=A0A9Q9B796_9PEZI|nr:hypothetical protein Slin14017_G085140 [Septoria linicola]USW59575.1 hypothetical protein Slin15195_G128940 [Septoria linicola]
MAGSQQEERKGFLDLPAENRNVVYDLVLHNSARITILSDSNRQLSKHGNDNLLPTFLLASPQVNQKATPVLYGSETFCIFAEDIEAFLAQIGPTSPSHLRTIQLVGIVRSYHDRSLPRALNSFSMLPRLQSLEVAANVIQAKKLAPLLIESMMDQSKDISKPDPLTVLRFSNDTTANTYDAELKGMLRTMGDSRKRLRTR